MATDTHRAGGQGLAPKESMWLDQAVCVGEATVPVHTRLVVAVPPELPQSSVAIPAPVLPACCQRVRREEESFGGERKSCRANNHWPAHKMSPSPAGDGTVGEGNGTHTMANARAITVSLSIIGPALVGDAGAVATTRTKITAAAIDCKRTTDTPQSKDELQQTATPHAVHSNPLQDVKRGGTTQQCTIHALPTEGSNAVAGLQAGNAGGKDKALREKVPRGANKRHRPQHSADCHVQ